VNTWWTLVFVLFGVVFGTIGIVLLIQTRRFLARALRVPGVVVDLVRSYSRSSNGGGSTTYRPVFRFQTYEGMDVEVTGNMGTNPPPARPGEQVNVLYDPGNPRNARLDKRGQRGGFVSWIFIGFGVVFTAIGVGLTIGLNL